jgi:hypothetical protein
MSPMQPEAGTMPARTERTPAGSCYIAGGADDETTLRQNTVHHDVYPVSYRVDYLTPACLARCIMA